MKSLHLHTSGSSRRALSAALVSLLVPACGKGEAPNVPAVAVADAANPAVPPVAAPTQVAVAEPTSTKDPAPAKPSAPPTPANADAAPARGPVAVRPGAGPRKRKVPARATRDAAITARREFNRLLEEGRKAVKSDDPTRGMELLEAALKQLPGHPSALGELGWAAFRAGEAHFDKALDATRRALEVSKKPRQKGALYYNLGRIAEARGDLDAAIRAYRTSLGYRPGNEIVQKRLEETEKRLAGPAKVAAFADLDGVCVEARGLQDCPVATSAEGQVMHGCECKTEIIGPEKTFGRAALLHVTGTTESAGGMVDAKYLAVEHNGQWQLVTMVANDWTPGMGYVYNNSTRRNFEFKRIGERDVLWVIFENSNTDLDPGVYTSYDDWSRTLIVCESEAAKVACWEVPLGDATEVSRFTFDEGEEIPEGQGPEKEIKEHWSLDATVADDGRIRIIVESGDAEKFSPVKDLPGTYSLRELVARPGVVPLAF